MNDRERFLDWAIDKAWGITITNDPEPGVASCVEIRSYAYRVRADFTEDGRLLAWSRNGRTQSGSLWVDIDG